MIDRATVEGQRRFPRSRGLQRAFIRGAQAQLDGQPIDACPYGRRRARRARGWPTVWRSAWAGGWWWASEHTNTRTR